MSKKKNKINIKIKNAYELFNKYKIILSCFAVSWLSSAGIIYYSANFATHVFPNKTIAIIFVTLVEFGLTTLFYIVAAITEKPERGKQFSVKWFLSWINVDYILIFFLYCLSVFSATIGLNADYLGKKTILKEISPDSRIAKYDNDIKILQKEIETNQEIMLNTTKTILIDNLRITNSGLNKKIENLRDLKKPLENEFEQAKKNNQGNEDNFKRENQDKVINSIKNILLKIFIAIIQFQSLRLSVLGSRHLRAIREGEKIETSTVNIEYSDVKTEKRLEVLEKKIQNMGTQLDSNNKALLDQKQYFDETKRQLVELAGELEEADIQKIMEGN